MNGIPATVDEITWAYGYMLRGRNGRLLSEQSYCEDEIQRARGGG